MANVCLVGITGLVGTHILSFIQASNNVSKVSAFTRKDLPSDAKTTLIKSHESSAWPGLYPSGAELFISSLGTTRGAAGGLENQRKIDYDLNLDLAKAAHAAGTKVYVLVSSDGASASSVFPYTKMKGELEEAVKEIGFDHVIILRPRLLLGTRAADDSRVPEYIVRKIAGFSRAISGGVLSDFWSVDADVVGRAAARAGLDALEGKTKEPYTLLMNADIHRLGAASK